MWLPHGKPSDTVSAVKRRVLLMVRHGQYDMREGSELRLTDMGRAQADHVGRSLAKERIDAFHASSLIRARETAELVRKHVRMDFTVSDLLCEGFPSRAKGYPTDTIATDRLRFDEAYALFMGKPLESSTELLVCHGNIIRYFVCRALSIPVSRWLRFATNHTGVTRLVVRDDGACGVVSYNETAHLPPELVT